MGQLVLARHSNGSAHLRQGLHRSTMQPAADVLNKVDGTLHYLQVALNMRLRGLLPASLKFWKVPVASLRFI